MPKIIEDIVIRNQENENNNRSTKKNDSFSLSGSQIEETPFVKEKEEREKEYMDEPIYKTIRPKYRPLREETTRKKGGIWVFAFVAVICLFVGLGTFFAEAKIVVYPKKAQTTLSAENFTATLNESTDTTVAYQYVSVSDSVTKNIEFTQSEEREMKASGKIVVYNNFSTSPQKLIATTRFKTPDGIIYMIEDPITVPGMTTKNGVSTPGSIEATVYAEKPGASYNKETADFVIPGFEGTAKYSKFYARSNGPITGGATGTVYFLNEEDSAKTESELNDALYAKLKERILAEIPDDLVVFDSTIVFAQDENISGLEGSSQKQDITRSGTMGVYAISKSDLAKQIAKKQSLLTENIEYGVEMLSFDGLSLTPSMVLNFTAPASWTFTLAGDATIGASVDTHEVLKSLLGKTKKEAKAKISEFSSVEKANVILTPFWRTRLPEEPEKLIVEISS